MKKIAFVLTAICFAINLQGQFSRHNYSAHNQIFNSSGIENLFSNSQQNGQPKSSLAIKQKLESDRTEAWNEATGKWITYAKTKYIYEENLNCTLWMRSYWDQVDNHWQDFQKTEITYNVNALMTSIVTYTWADYIKQWIYMDKQELENDAMGNCISACSYTWNEYSGQWEKPHKEIYAYDTKGNRTSMISQHVDKTTSQWVAFEKEEYNYDAKDNITGNNIFYWNDLTGEWVNNQKHEYIYDSEGNNVIFRETRFNVNDSVWIETRREENTFDNNRNRIMQVTNNWGALSKTESTFDSNYPFEELILPFSGISNVQDYFRHMWTGSIYYSHTESGWAAVSRGTLIYSEVNTSKNPLSENNTLCAYPNPASEYVSFEADIPLTGSTLELSDMQGRKVLTEVVENNTPVSIKHLGTGLYMYHIFDDDMVYTGKLVIE